MVILSKGAGAKRALLRRGGTPGETRTHYIPLRRRTLYPGEVRGHKQRVQGSFYLILSSLSSPFVSGAV